MTLVGRDTERDLLRAEYDRCVRGGGGVVVLGGPVGCGRTELLYEFCDSARAAGAVVLSATGSAMERTFPLAVLHQLLLTAPLDPAQAAKAERLLEEGALAATAYSSRLTAPVVQGLCAALLRLARQAPLVLAVDDAQDIDPQSLECLLFLIRRIRTAAVLVVFAERSSAPAPHPLANVELVRQPHLRRIELGLLGADAVGELLADRLGRSRGLRLAAEWHAISGGNPLLVSALIDDFEASARSWSGCSSSGVVIGEAFRRNLVSCLYRLEPTVFRAAGALAMLGQAATADLVGGVLGVQVDAAEQALRALAAAGLLERGWFRHPDARAEVLRSIDPETQVGLHRRAAYLLYGSDVEATRVARHLAAAGDVRAPWAAPILQAAAQQALDAGSTDSAVQWLRLAQRAGVDERQRAEARTALIKIETRLDPGSVSRHVPWIAEVLGSGLLDGRLGVSAVKYAFWHGRPAEATAALGRLDSPDRPADVRLRALKLWLSYWYPDVVPAGGPDDPGPGRRVGPIEQYATGGLGGLVTYLRDHDPDAAVARAEKVLRGCGKNHRAGALESLTAALTTLVYADRADRAASWCEPLVEQTTGECSPMWRALFTAVRAQAAMRLGTPALAVQYARSAVDQVQLEGWGVAVGIPLAVLTTAKVALGEFEHAARYLAVPVPEAMFRTPAGAHYLYARGGYHLALGRPEAALADFSACSDFVGRHGVDLPGIVPWRLGAAQAYLKLGRTQQAATLAGEQVDLCAGRPTRTRGVALRIAAAAARPQQRPALLEEAVGILQSVGDQLELAYALADLASVYHDLGESARARTIERRALHLKRLSCGEPGAQAGLGAGAGTAAAAGSGADAVAGPRSSTARPVFRSQPSVVAVGVAAGGTSGPAALPQVTTGSGHDLAASASMAVSVASAPDGDSSLELSDAERRVATMAARGMTNRQISAKLYITISTVEQHLTRIYRKLGVSKRSDLPTWLEPDLIRG
ncbi:MAG TPA: AAA family ATPase [Actinocrinis sp.]|nr:AAA family ATPase [Actinocrinis sp.]